MNNTPPHTHIPNAYSGSVWNSKSYATADTASTQHRESKDKTSRGPETFVAIDCAGRIWILARIRCACSRSTEPHGGILSRSCGDWVGSKAYTQHFENTLRAATSGASLGWWPRTHSGGPYSKVLWYRFPSSHSCHALSIHGPFNMDTPEPIIFRSLMLSFPGGRWIVCAHNRRGFLLPTLYFNANRGTNGACWCSCKVFPVF